MFGLIEDFNQSSFYFSLLVANIIGFVHVVIIDWVGLLDNYSIVIKLFISWLW